MCFFPFLSPLAFDREGFEDICKNWRKSPQRLSKASTPDVELITRKRYINVHMCMSLQALSFGVCVCPFSFSWKDDFCCLAAVTGTDGAAEKEEEERPQIKHGGVICKGDPLTPH